MPIEVIYVFLISGTVNAVFAPWAMNLYLTNKPITPARILSCFVVGICPGAGQCLALLSWLAVLSWYLDDAIKEICRLVMSIPSVKKFLHFEIKK